MIKLLPKSRSNHGWVSIDILPKIVDKRVQAGDFEVDTIKGDNRK